MTPVTTEGTERTVIVGAGGALDFEPNSFKGGVAGFVENAVQRFVLEFELGAQSVWGRAGRELSTDLLCKWPRRLTTSLDLMVGAGPTVVRTERFSWGVEFAVDLMWWPSRRVGMWTEPVYDLLFRSDKPGTFGATAGPIFGW